MLHFSIYYNVAYICISGQFGCFVLPQEHEKRVTNLRVPMQRSDGRAQWHPCNMKRLLSLLVIRATNINRKV